MRGKRIHFYILLVIAVTAGLALGYMVHLDRLAALEGRANPDSTLRVLAIKGVLPREFLLDFERESGIRVIVSEADSPESLWDRFESPTETFDLVSLFSYQIPHAIHAVKLQPLDPAKVRGFGSVSADFRDVPGELGNQRVLPVLWGATGILYDSSKFNSAPDSWKDVFSRGKSIGKVGLLASAIDLARWLPEPAEGAEESEEPLPEAVVRRTLNQLLSMATLSTSAMSSLELLTHKEFAAIQMNHGETAFLPAESASWKFTLPEEKAGFWILSLAMTRETKSEAEVHRFLDHVMIAENSAKLALGARQASTNKAVETLDIDSRLKPSYLREMPLTRLSLLRDFRSARTLRGMLGTITATRSH